MTGQLGLTHSVSPYRNRNLFSDYYLEHVLASPHGLAEWLAPPEMFTAIDALKALWQTENVRLHEGLNESQTEETWVKPVLDILGFKGCYEVQTGSYGGDALQRPDYVFFATPDDRRALPPDHPDFCTRAIAVGDAKRWGRNLDKYSPNQLDAGSNKNPNWQIDAYMRATNSKWGILTNGELWRIYNIGTSYRLDSYYEVNLPALIESLAAGAKSQVFDKFDAHEDFKFFYLFFRREAFSGGAEAYLERVLKESRDFSTGIENTLKSSVCDALETTIAGFLHHPDNGLTADDLPRIKANALILLYRLLFILYAEARELLPREKNGYRKYSLDKLKKDIADQLDKREEFSPTATVFWERLRNLAAGIQRGDKFMDLPAYNGGLFDDVRHADLNRWRMGDKFLGKIIEGLARVPKAAVAQTAQLFAPAIRTSDRGYVDYRTLSPRELGSIYESILELQPHVATQRMAQLPDKNRTVVPATDVKAGKPKSMARWFQPGDVYLANDKGERKASGSYYTPDYIVKYIVEQTLGPLVEDRSADEILQLNVLDPAMGSGHFLVAATDYLAGAIAAKQSGGGEVSDKDTLAIKRLVVERCIHGVDLQPLAVELAKVSLWLNTFSEGKPLGFLDHHLRCGNSLLGARITPVPRNYGGPNGGGCGTAAPAVECGTAAPAVECGTAAPAVECGTAAPAVASSSPNGRLAEGPDAGSFTARTSDWDLPRFHAMAANAVQFLLEMETHPSERVADVKEKETQTEAVHGMLKPWINAANLWVAAHFDREIETAYPQLLAATLGREHDLPPETTDRLLARAAELAAEKRFFHWELEYPDAFFDDQGRPLDAPGFDAVIGNPPWVRQEGLGADKAVLKSRFQTYHGVADLYVYFVELGNTAIRPGGRFGYIVPNKFLRANYGKTLCNFLASNTRLEALVDFGDLPVFTGAITYPLIVLTSRQDPGNAPVRHTQVRELLPDGTPWLNACVSDTGVDVPRAAFASAPWALAGEATQALLAKMEAASISLRDWPGVVINYGIKTGFNEAFVIDAATRAALIAEDPRSAEIIKPFLIGEDIKRYQSPEPDRFIILSRMGTPIHEYPALFAHLSKFQEQLEKRWDKGDYWWELRACAYYDAFEKPKVMWPVISVGPNFAFAADEVYSNDKTFFTATDDVVVLATLNSRLLAFFFDMRLTHLQGGFHEFRAQTVGLAPIRRFSETTPNEDRASLAAEATARYEAGEDAAVRELCKRCLAAEPEQADVVHDVLAALAQRMLDVNAARRELTRQFGDYVRHGMRLDLSVREVPPDWESFQSKMDKGKAKPAWKADALQTYRSETERFAAEAATLDARIAFTDRLIDQIVYALYGLTDEEIAIVEA